MALDSQSERNERLEAWYVEHGDYPRLVLGHRDDRGVYRCLDHPSTKRRRLVVLASDVEGECAECVECGRHLRVASLFGEVDESNAGRV